MKSVRHCSRQLTFTSDNMQSQQVNELTACNDSLSCMADRGALWHIYIYAKNAFPIGKRLQRDHSAACLTQGDFDSYSM